MKTTVITSGHSFTDIDALACAVAYTELLRLEGKKAEAILPGKLNHSVTETVKLWNFDIKTDPTDNEADYVLVDISNVKHFASFVREESVIEIYDHHYGFQEYWNSKLGKNSHIEMIGACATLIWEEFKKRGFSEKITTTSANLLLTAIISNTLNLGAQITHPRDIDAYEELKKYADVTDGWIGKYFSEQEKSVYDNIKETIVGDTKIVDVPTLDFPIVLGQLELWDSYGFLKDHMVEIEDVLKGFGHPHWIMNLPSISEKKNYFYSSNQDIQNIFSKIINARFENNIGFTDKLWLRKEIRKKLSEMGSSILDR